MRHFSPIFTAFSAVFLISGCAKVGLMGNGKGPTFNIGSVTPPTVIVKETPPPLAGFAVSSGGGISTGAGIQTNQPSGVGITVQATIGEPVGGSTVQTGNGVTVISNLEGSLQ